MLDRDHCGLLIIDIQEKISAVMLHRDSMIAETEKLIRAFRILKLPCFITEQYPKGLGRTVPRIQHLLRDVTPDEKLTFSGARTGDIVDRFMRRDVRQVIIAGIEAHVCVCQTVLDLLEEGFIVHVAADATSSRKEIDYRTALWRMRQAGAVITTVETVLFELLEEAGTEEFRTLSAIVK
jgi:hypothetical protein